MFEKIGKFIFKEFFHEIVDDFEKRISELEMLKNYVGDNKSEIREINNDLKEVNITTAKAEATIKTMLFLSKDKINQLGDGTNK